ncbi:MAG: CvpA family protein [Anaerolineales bacterium]|jgi:uncharacterized membrane protein required for colicin V production|nr:MAG: CvpA family protein [Anaerolineales bacterium]
MFNALDFLLIFFLVIGMLWGLLRGAGRLVIGLFSLYVGLVISLVLHRPLARFFRNLLAAMSVQGSQSLAFVFLLLVSVNGLSFLTRYLSTPPEERKRTRKGELQEAMAKSSRRFLTGPLNQLFGLLVGLLVTIVWISLILAVFQFAVGSGWPAANSTRVAIQGQIGTSTLVPRFNDVLRYIYWSVRIWVPGDVPRLFSGLVEQAQ